MTGEEIKIYSTPACPNCQRAKKFLAQHGIPFQEIDVSKDRAALRDMIQKTGQMSVPVIELPDEILVGFDKDVMMARLGLKPESDEKPPGKPHV